MNRKKCRTLSRAEEESKRRAEGLEKQVDPTNKGFSMLIKMGYAPGRGLGKNGKHSVDSVALLNFLFRSPDFAFRALNMPFTQSFCVHNC